MKGVTIEWYCRAARAGTKRIRVRSLEKGTMAGTVTTRFAPSPTGFLHLGHAYAALIAAREAEKAGGRFLVRIEDLDQTRARAEFEAAIYEDLAWLGLRWEEPVMRQSDRRDAYGAALERLKALGVVYPCFCTRKDIQAEIERAVSAPHGPDGPLYPGICRDLSQGEVAARLASGARPAMRLNMGVALGLVDKALTFREGGRGSDGEAGTIDADPAQFGDIILMRKDAPASYHLAVVVDDAAQGVSLVTRGRDLFPASHVHRLLQALLGLPVPDYLHHDLITDTEGRRLAKRDKAQTLRTLRAEGMGVKEVRRRLNLT